MARLFGRHGVTEDEYLDVVQELCDCAERVFPQGDAPPNRDEEDRKFLHCAAFGRVDYLITRDPDLLDQKTIDGALIVTPGNFLRMARAEGIPLYGDSAG